MPRVTQEQSQDPLLPCLSHGPVSPAWAFHTQRLPAWNVQAGRKSSYHPLGTSCVPGAAHGLPPFSSRSPHSSSTKYTLTGQTRKLRPREGEPLAQDHPAIQHSGPLQTLTLRLQIAPLSPPCCRQDLHTPYPRTHACTHAILVTVP